MMVANYITQAPAQFSAKTLSAYELSDAAMVCCCVLRAFGEGCPLRYTSSV